MCGFFKNFSCSETAETETVLNTIGNKNGFFFFFSVREVLNLILREMAAKGRECLFILG